MIPRFFIDRPIFATVLSVFITLAGAVALTTLPVAQYPEVAPPTIQIDCNYPGASALVVSQSIAAPIEQQVNGVEDMLYMNSQCTSEGSYTCTITFQPGTDLNMAQVRTQNRVNLAMPQLPDVVRATGVTTRKRSPELLLTVGITSPPEPGYPQGRYDQLFLSNYSVLKLREELQRQPGISDVTIFGIRDYAMRVWLDPDKLAGLNLTAPDVVAAVRAQNLPLAAGQVGQPPAGGDQPYQFTIDGVGRLSEPEEFGKIVVKVGPAGQLVRIRDVSRRVELGAKASDVSNRFNDKPTVGLAIFVLPDCNALETRDAVVSTIDRLSKDFPPGIKYEVGYDTTPFIRESIAEVFHSLRDAIVLVSIVVLLFLQSWRAAIIPLAAVPVAIVGTFAAMAAVGFSVNLLTLFGLILAVGIVVDDAIVVVEAVQHQLDQGHAPREATVRAMREVTGPIVAVGVVLSFVFLPCVFISGIVGAFFKQFALTIAASTLISTFNSLTLSPALCALLLKADAKGAKRGRLATVVAYILLPLTLIGRLFDRAFNLSGRGYVKLVGLFLRVPVLVLVGYAAIVGGGVLAFQTMPTGFIPQQDKGYLVCSIQLPDAASSERTQEVISLISRVALNLEIDADGQKAKPIKFVNAIAGNSFVLSAYGSNFGSMFVILDQFEHRRSPKLTADAIAGKLREAFARAAPEAQVNVFGAPAVPRLGRAGGFRIMIEDRGDVGPDILQGQTQNLVEQANRQPQLVGLFTVFKTNSPQIFLDVDPGACAARGLELSDVYATLQGTMGSRYANDFNQFGRTWQVNVQSDAPFRNELEDVKKLKVRNKTGGMVPLGTVLVVKERSGPLVITRYNMYPAAAVNGNIAPGTSTGDGIAVLEKLADRELPARMSYEWTELTFLEKMSRNTGALVFGLSVVFVFLVLAALYESWAFPFAVILVVPVCVACSLAAVWLTDPMSAAQTVTEWNKWLGGLGAPQWVMLNDWSLRQAAAVDAGPIAAASRWMAAAGVAKQDVNVFTQVGFVVLIGLACKNAILIVEFAKVARDGGADLRTAVLDACKLRYRPIMMTSVAFMLGVLPLAIAQGAGAEMRQAIGIAVLGGMLGVTVFGVVLTPVFFYVVDRVTHGRIATHPWVVAVSGGLLYALRLKFVRPLAAAARRAATAAVRRAQPPLSK
ncbi:transporter : Transporter, hydrophobe/amphiphile efflux-1 (HAE1) family OS=Planctomyces limnophilus (strain ATCC 43296 / DSM 3776 / IFAM 1008 / 290) GN=Plim_2294 PE=4 SV=1: ACR_tran: ACR_tran [Gemmataceae bacterium]|nr:transporter : Transporter, hydrophobe/amphiphile efflux-1 (HAE1) family OS=Planctomyces limnophilus (strain ATCC 43296 / DSM 3776 / IFAM 1008 / 290) GN=Plim_2294 PE=4 SV=1: ACR_tran: ACR_tran [Gemmataceae bacterium]VTT96916.1 transporter : Transporter, hydrophobe/amphiphile efflux-1 (HAE1) family OS=Planctomyces limnophilus (strain ATCC 43296 / DSM 3776 / IFAM 1008 / 290) GN=Plim_2294 PE=4 SV=1: ACR_tran: ACR_tran [Gemmataceae bacterium]